MLEGPADKKKPEGGSLREHLESVERQSGFHDPLLDSVKPPEGFEYLLQVWLEVRGGASEGFGGVRLTWRDLADYQAVTGITLDAFEVEAIMAVDGAFRAKLQEKADGS